MAENVERKNNRVNIKSRFERVKEKLKNLKGGLTSSLVVFIIIHVVMLTIGAIKFKECPASPNIPVYLIAEGSVWVYSAFEPKYDPIYGDQYCNRTAYLFALIFISCIYIIIFITLFVILCVTICCCAAICVGNDADVEESTIPERTPLPTIQSAD